MLRYIVILVLVLGLVQPTKATAVTDLIDLPFEAQGLITAINDVRAGLDQLIVIMDTLDHWRAQARRLTRNGFRLRDLERFFTQTTYGSFLSGGDNALTRAVDEGGDPGTIVSAMQEIFPPAPLMRDWDTGTYQLTDTFRDRVAAMEKATALSYTGAAEAFSAVGKSRRNFEENKAAYDAVIDQFENPAGGEQEALDLINVQLGQLVNTYQQENQMIAGMVAAKASGANEALLQEAQRRDEAVRVLRMVTNARENLPEVQDDIL